MFLHAVTYTPKVIIKASYSEFIVKFVSSIVFKTEPHKSIIKTILIAFFHNSKIHLALPYPYLHRLESIHFSFFLQNLKDICKFSGMFQALA